MRRVKYIEVLGDSVLKGIQVDPDTGRYVTRNEMDLPGLEREFDVSIHNASRFGCTTVKGAGLLERILSRGAPCDAVVMDFGGNDCDFRWPEIAADPEGVHWPNVPLAEFVERYRGIIRRLRSCGIMPVLTTLPPLESQHFFDWWCRGLDQAAVRRWLGSVSNICAHQENYSRAVERLAREERTLLVDLRGAFLDHGHVETLLCEDGTHPNAAGQKLIAKAFEEFGYQWKTALQSA